MPDVLTVIVTPIVVFTVGAVVFLFGYVMGKNT